MKWMLKVVWGTDTKTLDPAPLSIPGSAIAPHRRIQIEIDDRDYRVWGRRYIHNSLTEYHPDRIAGLSQDFSQQ